jgi:hypothetical protein
MAFPFSSGGPLIDHLMLRLENYPQDRGTRPIDLLLVIRRRFLCSERRFVHGCSGKPHVLFLRCSPWLALALAPACP